MPDQAPAADEEVLDGSDLEYIEDDQGPPTDPQIAGSDPLAPGDTDPTPGAAQGQYPPQQQGYPQQQPAMGYPQQPAGYHQQPSPAAATLPPDSLHYSPEQGFAPAQAPSPAPAQQVHREEDPTSQQDQRAIQAAIDGTPYTTGPKLLIIGGNNRGREFPLNTGGDTTIGRGVDNHIILADIAVSRKHTLVGYEGGQFVMRDLGSGNGTLINGRRMESHHLRDGDQLEMGNTLLRYVNPVAAAAPAPAPAPAGGPISQVATDNVPIAPLHPGAAAPMGGGDMRQATQMAAPLPPVRPIPAADGNARRRKLLIFGGVGLIVFLGAMIGLKTVLGGKKAADAAAQQGPAPDQIAAQEFQEGTTEFREKNWEKAQTHFLKVLKLAPNFGDAQRYADQAGAELKAQIALKSAQDSLKAKDYKASRLALSKVPSNSSYVAETRKLKQKVDDDQLTYLIQEAKKHKEAGENEAALAKITTARDLAPTNQVVKDLYAELSTAEPSDDEGDKPTRVASRRPSGGGSTARRPTGGGSTTRRKPSGGGSSYQRADPGPQVKAIKVGGGAKQALAHYKNQEWAKAFQSIKSYASAQSGSRKKKAEQLADAIRKVGQNWLRAGRGGTSTAAALKYYQQAMIYDKKVKRGGMHQATLKDLCFKQARKEATTALARGKYTTAFAAYKLARRFGKDDAVLRKVADGLDQKAQALFTKGYTKRSTNIAYARKCWQQVLKMVPPSSSPYQKAYKWLNESTPSYEDEDED